MNRILYDETQRLKVRPLPSITAGDRIADLGTIDNCQVVQIELTGC